MVDKVTGFEKSMTKEIEESAKSFAYELLTMYDWNWLKTTDTDSSVGDQTTYTLQGAAKDCGKLIMLKYENVVIEYFSQVEFYERTQNQLAGDYHVQMWTIIGYDSAGFPKIDLFGAPDVSGNEIWYLYLKKIDESDPQNLIPGWMMNIIRTEMMAEFHANPSKSQMYFYEVEKRINQALWIEREKHGLNVYSKTHPDRVIGNAIANRFVTRRSTPRIDTTSS